MLKAREIEKENDKKSRNLRLSREINALAQVKKNFNTIISFSFIKSNCFSPKA